MNYLNRRCLLIRVFRVPSFPRKSSSSFSLFSRRETSTSSNSALTNKQQQQQQPPSVIFFGTDILSLGVLRCLHRLMRSRKISDLKVVTSSGTLSTATTTTTTTQTQTQTPTMMIKGNKIIGYCIENKIDYFTWNQIKEDRSKSDIKSKESAVYEKYFSSFDVGLIASFGHLIPSSMINYFPFGIVNLHPSLLPRWRGASPILFSILFDDKQVGVSLMKIMGKQFDIGPLLSQKSIETPHYVTTVQLIDRLTDLGNEMLEELFDDFRNRIHKTTEQSNENVTYAHKITSEMYFVEWRNQTVKQIECQYRAFHELGHLKTKLNGEIVKLVDMVGPFSTDETDSHTTLFTELNEHLCNALDQNAESGIIKYLKKFQLLAIKCKDGYVCFRSVILRKKLSAKDFHNGYLNNRHNVKFESIPNDITTHIYTAKLK